MSDKLSSRQKSLLELFGAVESSEAFDTLEDRSQDAGHLEDDDYARLAGAGAADPEVANLQRHVLFCQVCSDEFLRRSAPAVEAEIREADARRPWWFVLGFLVLATGVVLVLKWAPWEESKPTEPQPKPPPKAAPPRRPKPVERNDFPVRVTRAARGAKAGRPDDADRIFVQVQGPQGQGAFAYVWLLSQTGTALLHPRGNEPPFLRTGLVPPRGWPDVPGEAPRQLLILLAERELAVLKTAGDRQNLTRFLRDQAIASRDPSRLNALLEQQLLRTPGRAFLVPLEE